MNLTPQPMPPTPATLPLLTDARLAALSRSLPFRAEAVIRHRWEEMRPAVTLHCAQRHDTCGRIRESVERFRQRHRVAVLLCLERGIPWPSIRRYRLDDVRCDDAAVLRGIDEAAGRRKSFARPQHRPRKGPKEQHADQ